MALIKSKKLTAAALTGLLVLQQAMVVPVMASEITGITAGNINTSDIGNGNTQFDIRPDVDGGNGFGFKHYDSFNLTQGDIANLIMEGGIDKFVNLVNQQIQIHGVLNSILNGDIGGHVIFVSPNGMVVGASGVLNVGSLTAIAPTAQAYNTYIANSALSGALPEGYTHENNLAVLKSSDMGNDIVINGKIIARDGVELIGQRVNIGNTADNKAGIVAGVDNDAVTTSGMKINQKLATTEAAGKLFDALVNNKVQNGAGFGKDANGNIVITAQSVKTATVSGILDKITLAGQQWALETIIDVNGDILPREEWPEELRNAGLTSEDILAAVQTMLNDTIPSEATDVNAHEETNYAEVNIQNAVLASNNIDANAVSRVDYTVQKGNSTLFNNMYGSNLLQMIEASVYGNYEGARAKASVTVGQGAELNALNDINLSSMAVSNTNMKLSSLFNPSVDSNEEYYYAMGTKTVSEVNVNDGAVLKAGNDVLLHAQSQNSHNIKIKNPTSTVGGAIGGKTLIPNIQISFLRTTMESDTTAAINSGATVEAKNVEVDAVNVSHDSTNVQSVATVSENSGAAIAVTLKDTNINTSAKIDSEIDTNGAGDVSVNAQNLHMSTNTSKAEVSEGFAYKNNFLTGGTDGSGGILKLISSKLSGLVDLGTTLQGLPNLSTALVINNSEINTTAQIGKNADIHADNVSVNANAIDLTVNTASSHVDHSTASGSQTGGSQVSQYIPNPGVAVIVNNQENNTTAEIQDGTGNNFAKVTANDTLSVNATTEMPRNGATFEFIINLLQTYKDVTDLPDDIEGNLKAQFGEDWDIRLLMQGITNPAGEVSYDISNVLFGFKNTGLTSNLGLQGFFNNWAETKSTVATGMGVAASVIDSSVTNNTTARIGDYSNITGGDVIVNAANQVVQYNAAGDVAKLWGITDGVKSGNGIGGTVVVENTESNAKAQVGDNVVIKNAEDVEISAANQQDFLTAVVTGSKATADNGFAISGSVTVQDVSGTTEASVGKSRIENAKNVKLNAGQAKINLVETAKDQLFGDNVFEELPGDDDRFEVGLDLDLTSPVISNFGGVDEETGLLSLKDSSAIKDGISNILIAGAIAQQSQEVSGGSGGTTGGTTGSSSSGGAVGASVNVSEFHRNVNAYIADGAYVKVDNALDVLADSYTQSLNIAIAGAFAGGVKVNEPGFIDKQKDKLKDKFSTLSGLFNKSDNKLANTNTTASTVSDKLDQHGRPVMEVDGIEYVTDSDGQYWDPQTGTVYKDSNGNPVKYSGSTGSEAPELYNTSSQGKNMSVAAAGSVNAQINNSTVKAEIGNATIISGNEVNVEANQSTKALNVGGGVAKAATVGAGAAVNFIENTNETTASLNGTDITFTGASSNALNVKAEENNDNVQVAIGVGVTKTGSEDTSTQVSAGGSFNTDILENKVKAELNSVDVKQQSGKNNIAVNVDAENHSTSYKGAGGLAVSTGQSGTPGQSGGTAVGAGMGGNLNLITKETTASINNNSNIQNAQSVNVTANKDSAEKTEDLISVGVGGTVITGAQSGYSFSGAMATDVINNTITAEIANSTVSAENDVNVTANNNIANGNLAGALGFSTSKQGVGVGVGAIVSVINNTVKASINNSTISKAGDVNVNAKNKEDLQFLAVNMGIQTDSGIPITANGIVNVIGNEIEAAVADSEITNSGNLSIISDYDNSIKGITGAGSISLGDGKVAVGANVISNVLSSSNNASIVSSDTNTGGKLTVQASTDEVIDTVPVALAITTGGSAAAAANVGVNVVQNSTSAAIDGKQDDKSNVTADSINVTASDNTQSRSRGGTLAVNGGSAAVGGTILADVYIKDVDAHIDNAVISDNGNLSVSASAKNIFGKENAGSVTAAGLVDKIHGDYDIQNDTNYQDWDMAYNLAGAASGSGAGSIVSKNVINNVEAYIGSGVTVEKAGNIEVLASNKTEADIIAGAISASGSAGVGASIFSNVNVSTVEASIKEGAQIGTEANTGSITVDASSEQIYKSIMAVVGAGASTAVSGSVNSNIIVNSTNAYIASNTNINSRDTITVDASDSMDVESINLGIAGAGTTSVGGVAYVNVLANKVNSTVGAVGSNGEKQGVINAANGMTVSASDDQNFLANVAVIAGSVNAAVGLVGVANVMSSEVNAGIKDITVNSDKGSISVNASNSFNGKHKDQTTGIETLLGKDSISVNDVTDLVPLVGVVSMSGSAYASVGGTVIANVVTTEVNSYVENALISTANGLNVNANSSMTTYDAALSVVGAGGAAVSATGVTNVYSGSTVASVTDSVIEKGSVSVNSNDEFNLNTILLSVAGSGGTSVNALTNVNTISNTTTAKIEDTEIKDASRVDVSAQNTVKETDILGAGAFSGGTAGNILPVVNVFTNDTNAFISGGSINNAATSVNSGSDMDVISAILGVTGSGAGTSAGGYVAVNVFDNDLNAYIDSVNITNAQSTSVNTNSDLYMNGIIGSVGISGAGAGVLLNGLVNVIKNNVNAYISNSDIEGGSVEVSAIQNAVINNNTASIAASGLATVSSNSLVSVFTNDLNAYIDNTSMDAVSVDVESSSKQDINNLNVGVGAAGSAAVNANVIVNVLENTTHAYINAKDNNMKFLGAANVTAKDEILLNNTMGLVAAAGIAGVGANINVNVINNAVAAEVLSSSNGLIEAGSLDVKSDSVIGLTEGGAAIAAGGTAGVATTVFVNSIGGKVDFSSNSELKDAQINESVASAAGNFSELTEGITYSKDGQEQSLDNSFNLTSGETKSGTTANISANVTTKGSDGITAEASNTLKGYEDDAFTSTNAAIAAGTYSAGVGVLVTDMKYNTQASIKGGNVTAENNGKINVNADSSVNADINAIEGNAGVISIGGNVGFFENNAHTTSQISNVSSMNAGNISVNSTSKDNIDIDVVSASIAAIGANISVSLAETNNQVQSLISGNVDIDASNLDVKSSNTSNLATSLDSLEVGGATFGVVVNRSESNALTNAIINASGNIDLTGDMNVIASSDNINAETTMSLGNISAINVSVTEQGAFVNSKFKAGIDNSDLTINNGGKTSILSGVKTSDNSQASVMSSKINSKKASITLAQGSSSSLNAVVNADTEAVLNSKKFTTNDLDVISKMQRTAATGGESASIGALTISNLNLNSSVSGSNKISLNGDNQIKNNANISLYDDSDVSTSMVSGNLSIVGADVNTAVASVDTDTTIDIGGNLAMNNMTVTSDVHRDSFNTAETKAGGLVRIGSYKMTTSTTGDSVSNIGAAINNDSFTNGLTVNSKAENTVDAVLSESNVALVAIAKEETTNTLDASNTINIKDADINSKGLVSFDVDNTNKASMRRDSQSGGVVVITSGSYKNNITSEAGIVVDNSDINASNLSLNSSANLGTLDKNGIEYQIRVAAVGAYDDTTVTNDVKQSSGIEIKNNSALHAVDQMNVNIDSTSDLKQSITSKGSGFLAENKATSNLTVTNNNNLTIDSNSAMYADDMNIAFDSNNNLSSIVDVKANHFGGVWPSAYANLTLNVNNTLDNSGKIEGGNNVEVGFMQNSRNVLTQKADMNVEASVATSHVGGKLSYNTDNKLNVNKGAEISSGKDVIVGYSNGNNDLSSVLHYKNISRLLFGIPITVEKTYSDVTQNMKNSLTLDGEIKAGSSAQRYMLIDKDGNVDMSALQGFLETEYKVVDVSNIDGEQLTNDAIQSMEDEIKLLTEKINRLESSAGEYNSTIESYEAQLQELNTMLGLLNGGSITAESAENTFKDNFKNQVVGNGANQITEDIFNQIWSAAADSEDFAAYIAQLRIEQTVTGEDGTTTTQQVALSTEQQNLLNSVFNSESSKFVNHDNLFTTYDGKVISETGDDISAIKTTLNSSIDNIESLKENLQSVADDLNSSLENCKNDITDLEDQIAYLKENPIADVNIEKAAIEFANISIPGAKIELNGIKKEDIKGSGNFRTYGTSFTVDNYSNRDLIFNNISLGMNGTSGLIINGVNYDYLANSTTPVNDNVHLIYDTENVLNDGNITINNYYDTSNPALTGDDLIQSDIIFGGMISSNKGLDVWNESGDITFKQAIDTAFKDIVASQGSIIYDSNAADFNLADTDRLIAGKDITINANNIIINGTVKAGYSDRNLTITEDMLNNLVVDPTTGEKNMVDLGGSEKSDYLNGTNNIKVLYKDGKLLVFNTKQEGGNVNFTGNVTGNGSVTYTDGYANVSITNNTDKELVVNNLDNNRMNGTFTNTGTLTNITNQGHTSASTTIDSVGAVNIAGIINNAAGADLSEEAGSLQIISENGILVPEKHNESGDVIASINSYGNTSLSNTENGSVIVDGIINNTNGKLSIANTADGVEINGTVSNTKGSVDISNSGSGSMTVAGVVSNTGGNTTLTNKGNGALTVSGTVSNTGGNTTVDNNGASGLTIAGLLKNETGNTTIKNTSGNLSVSGTVSNVGGNTTAGNEGDGTFEITGTVSNDGGSTKLTNAGDGALNITDSAAITNTNGNMTVENNGIKGLAINGILENTNGNTKISNTGSQGMSVNGSITNTAQNGTTELSNTDGNLTIGEKGVVSNISETDADNLIVNNSSKGLFALLGRLFNKKGNTIVNNTSSGSGVKIASTGSITNDNGDISLTNKGKQGLTVEGIVNSKEQDISINNENSDIIIGEYDSDNDFYINSEKGNVSISQSGGSILNGIVDSDKENPNSNHDLGNKDKAYKTLINTGKDLTITVKDGSIGSDTHALDGKDSGFGINASTRDYTESINVKVQGVVNASASNNGNALINLRAKDSEMKVGQITSDGGVMLTAADWKQADQKPAPSDEEYYTGYSIINALADGSKPNVSGKNISIITSNNLGSADKAFIYNQLDGGSVSVMAENDINLKGTGAEDNIWQLITKRGDLNMAFSGNAVIREINAANNLKIVSTGENLTIYDLGKTSNLSELDDILQPHDQLGIASVAPETVDISVLDINPDNDSTPGEGNSTLNIYNAYVKGQNNGNVDVRLRADNIIAHAYDAASSPVSNTARPNGFDATENRTYANDITDKNADKNLKATGFNTVGQGDKLVFDIQGVSQSDVINAGGDVNDRTYNPQNSIDSVDIFKNPNGFEGTVYKAKDVTLSLNSSKDSAPTDNRGMEILKLYSDNAYVDTKDLNLSITDAFITNYAEFRNGNRGGTGIGDFVDMQNGYRWLAVVDNDYHRIISNNYNIPVTSQLYTDKTGSFSLNLGNTIDVLTEAPIVHYNPNTVVNTPDTENSFYRLTYKDNKIQYVTTTPDFDDIDKSTYKPTKRTSIRFNVPEDAGFILVSEKKKDNSDMKKRIIRVEDISREGVSVVHDGSLQKGETFTINLVYKDIEVSPEVEVVRVSSDKAGLKFINMDKATANRILYLNMFVTEDMPLHVSQE